MNAIYSLITSLHDAVGKIRGNLNTEMQFSSLQEIARQIINKSNH